jgi:hypothetical protein
MDIASSPFDAGRSPGQYRHHTIVLAVLALCSIALSILIWIYVPNEGDSPLFGWLLDGLRDALLVLLWSTFALFAAASTLALSAIPARWNSALRLLVAYAFGFATLVAVAWYLLQRA